MISRSLFTFTIIFALVSCKIGDKPFFCNFPEFFDTTVRPAQTFVDLNLYSGVWYEVARAPFNREQNCICTEAHYTFDEQQNKFTIKNICLKEDGSISNGTIGAHSKNKYNTFLKASFILPFIGDPEYKWVVVGEPCRKNYWILSRERTLDRSFIMEKQQQMIALGFPSKIILREETCNQDIVE